MSGRAPVDDAEWNTALSTLAQAADAVLVLSRCLAVGPELERWRATADQIDGQSAADGLDQARGELERLVDGGADELLSVVSLLLQELPLPLE